MRARTRSVNRKPHMAASARDTPALEEVRREYRAGVLRRTNRAELPDADERTPSGRALREIIDEFIAVHQPHTCSQHGFYARVDDDCVLIRRAYLERRGVSP